MKKFKMDNIVKIVDSSDTGGIPLNEMYINKKAVVIEHYGRYSYIVKVFLSVKFLLFFKRNISKIICVDECDLELVL